MIDAATNKPVRVSTPETAPPLIDVSLDQRDKVVKLLQDNGIPHWAEYLAVSINGGPPMIVIHLRQGVNPVLVQTPRSRRLIHEACEPVRYILARAPGWGP
jgi:hypothetical protein